MSVERFDLEADVESAWVGFRGRLADRLAGMEEDGHLLVEMESLVDDEDEVGCAPYLQFSSTQDVVRAEAASNTYLHDHHVLSGEDSLLLVELGWAEPTCGRGGEPAGGSANYYVDLEQRDADRLAVMTVRSLREVYGCAHPAFLVLTADGIEDEPADCDLGTDGATAADIDEEIATFPANHEELVELVDRAISVMLEGPPMHDDDGDIPMIAGDSVVFVRVAGDKPAVNLFAQIVVQLEDEERVDLELAILNRTHPSAKFYEGDATIVMTQQLCAWPFAPGQLRAVLAEMLGEVDELAKDLAIRLSGVRYMERLTDEFDEVDDNDHDEDPGLTTSMAGLLEMLADGPVTPDLAANMFSLDDELIVNQIARLTSGADEVGDRDVDDVVRLLRQALRYVVEDRAARNAGGMRMRVPPRPSSQQVS